MQTFRITEKANLQSFRAPQLTPAKDLNDAIDFADENQSFEGTIIVIENATGSAVLAIKDSAGNWAVVEND